MFNIHWLHKRNKKYSNRQYKNLDVMMPIYNLIECSNNYSKTSGRLKQYYKNDLNDDLSNPKSFNFKAKLTGKAPNMITKKMLK